MVAAAQRYGSVGDASKLRTKVDASSHEQNSVAKYKKCGGEDHFNYLTLFIKYYT